MATRWGALAALVEAKRDDPVLIAHVTAAARRIRAETQAMARALNLEARQLRVDAWQNLPKCDFEAARSRLGALRGLGLQDGVRVFALQAARRELDRERRALHEAAKALEAAVGRAKDLDARAAEAIQWGKTRPEMIAWEIAQQRRQA